MTAMTDSTIGDRHHRYQLRALSNRSSSARLLDPANPRRRAQHGRVLDALRRAYARGGELKLAVYRFRERSRLQELA